MKTDKIMVGINGVTLTMASGAQAKAVYPAGKGEDTSYLLMTDGKIANMKGSRLHGVGIARFLTERGFALATKGDMDAEKLADHVDAIQGTKLIESAAQTFAQELTKQLAEKVCTIVPFEPEKPVQTVTIEKPRGYTTTVFDLESGFCSSQVGTEYQAGRGGDYSMGVTLSRAWIVGPDGNPDAMPRCTEYGGIVEHAVFVICNSGIGELVGNKNLEMNHGASIQEMYPRGRMDVRLKNGDLLVVGIDGGDELTIHYERAGAILYSRQGMVGNGNNALRLGSVIGAIAAVIVRVQEMDATPVKATRTRVKQA